MDPAAKLIKEHDLTKEELACLIRERTPESAALLATEAVRLRGEVYGNEVFVRGLIEISSYCRNDCRYCGIRRSNRNAERYRLSEEDILACCEEGYRLGFRTFVLQGGEDPYYTDEVLKDLIRKIKAGWPDCAVTLSLGERSRASYACLKEAGADRYLLRHETADPEHYALLHPPELSWEHRMQCLRDLKDLGYQTGCGFMVGSPGQTEENLAEDLIFIKNFRPEMCGIGPFIPHKDTEYANEPAGTVELTCFLLSVLRILQPDLLLPATTALATIDPLGREKGMLSGANVVMPNLSPREVRKKYALYDGKVCTGDEAAECRDCLARRMESVGFRIVTSRGDHVRRTENQ